MNGACYLLRPTLAIYIVLSVVLAILWCVFGLAWFRNSEHYAPLLILSFLTPLAFIAIRWNEIKVENGICTVKKFPFTSTSFNLDNIEQIKVASNADSTSSNRPPYSIVVRLKTGEVVYLNAKLYGIKALADLSNIFGVKFG